MIDLTYNNFQTKSYLTSSKISTRRKKLLFRARTRMLPVGDNFGKKEELCPLCCLQRNTQFHLLECVVIKMHCPEILANNTDSKYEDIFSDDPVKMNNVSKYLESSLRKREQLIR